MHLVNHEVTEAVIKGRKPVFVTVGETTPKKGDSFMEAGLTFARENGGGMVYAVHSGADMLSAMEDYNRRYGQIESWANFSHGGQFGMYVQQPGRDGSFYANGESGIHTSEARFVSDLDPSLFADYPTINILSCNCGTHPNGMAAQLADRLNAYVWSNHVVGNKAGMTNISRGRGVYYVPDSRRSSYTLTMPPARSNWWYFWR
jgi:hypothetical protein